MNYIVYKIANNFNEKIYIGQTTETLENRWKRHIGYQLKDGTYLHNSMNKYGVENFYIEVIEIVNSQEELDEREKYWIDYYDSANRDKGYNLKNVKGKCGGDTLTNHPNLEEIKKKISESKKGGKNPNSTKVKAINILTKKEKTYNSISECKQDLDIPRHDIISKRCRGVIKKPYNNTWSFSYL